MLQWHATTTAVAAIPFEFKIPLDVITVNQNALLSGILIPPVDASYVWGRNLYHLNEFCMGTRPAAYNYIEVVTNDTFNFSHSSTISVAIT